ncbi:hypothetical protein RHOFW510R12_02935 [Rhodanobacter sp. FW510-R12]|uniref:phospholipase D family protein n=1 Tax=Rhodanobacter TaxID=75309 RepID=UPI00041A3244|nr:MULTISPECIES: phospholipase D family protein [Rhodanobacter]UJJ55204.1 phospholipase D family protein [Rhodanobacter thiooxydans]
MLEPNLRSILLDELRPPDGFRLDGAVATTFTLSLVAAVLPPLAFASAQLQGTSDPIAALEAIRSSADRMDIFCQVGQIGVPTNAPDLVAFLETMIHEVKAPRSGYLFHPKFWALRFIADGGDTRHRLVVLTRNLTNDHTWDVAVRLDGQMRGGPKAINRPVAELIRTLPDLVVHTPISAERRDRINALAEQFRRVEWDAPEDVRLEAFHVFGIPSVQAVPDFSGYKHLVISPFIKDDGLDMVTADKSSENITVISRVHDLDQLSPEWAGSISSFQLTGSANLDDDDEGMADPERLTGLHAKVYVVERNRRAHIFIGSANATGPAFDGNVEILVEMSGGATKVGVDSILGKRDDKGALRAMLDEYPAAGGVEESAQDIAQRELKRVARTIAEIGHVVTVGDGTAPYDLAVTTSESVPLPAGYRASLRLLTVPGKAVQLEPPIAAPLSGTFPSIPLADITPFLVWEVTSPASIPPLGTVVRAKLINEPIGRLDEILARQVDSLEKFFRFLTLLLGFGASGGVGDEAVATGDGTGNAFFRNGGGGVFEMVVRALADRPESIKDLDGLIQRMESSEQGRQIAGDKFLVLWQKVRKAAGLATGATRG